MLFILRFFPSLCGSFPIIPCRGARSAKTRLSVHPITLRVISDHPLSRRKIRKNAALCPSDHSADHFRSSPSRRKIRKNAALCPSDHSAGHFRSSLAEAQGPQKRGSLSIRSLCGPFPILSCRSARSAKTRLSVHPITLRVISDHPLSRRKIRKKCSPLSIRSLCGSFPIIPVETQDPQKTRLFVQRILINFAARLLSRFLTSRRLKCFRYSLQRFHAS